MLLSIEIGARQHNDLDSHSNNRSKNGQTHNQIVALK